VPYGPGRPSLQDQRELAGHCGSIFGVPVNSKSFIPRDIEHVDVTSALFVHDRLRNGGRASTEPGCVERFGTQECRLICCGRENRSWWGREGCKAKRVRNTGTRPAPRLNVDPLKLPQALNEKESGVAMDCNYSLRYSMIYVAPRKGRLTRIYRRSELVIAPWYS